MTEKTHDVIPQAASLPARAIMHPLVERMIANNPTPEVLEKVLALQREWERDEAKRAYNAALVELKRALPPFLIRDKTVDFTGNTGKRTNYTHTSLAAAMETVTPLLSEYGFSLTWKPGNAPDGKVRVTIKLAHRQGHFEESIIDAVAEGGGNKSGPQAVASTITLLARYGSLGMLGLATADMKEPSQEQEPEGGQIDTARNMKAMASLVKTGKTREEIEKYAGKPMTEWTSLELDKLRAWTAPVAPKEEPPGELIAGPQMAALKALLKEFNLTPDAFAGLIEVELGCRPKTMKDITTEQYKVIVKAFDTLRKGEWQIRDGRFDKPPAFPAEMPEDKDVPF